MNQHTNSVIIQINDVATSSTSLAEHIGRITGYIDPKNFVKLMDGMSIESNPRKPKESSVTRDIRETLETNPSLFHMMSKGILLSANRCDPLERSRFRLSFDENGYAMPGILDGGHNTFAIAKHLLSKVADEDELKAIKDWDGLMPVWQQYCDELAEAFKSDENSISPFHTPIEVIFPRDAEDEDVLSKWGESHRDITHARNNNTQLTDSTKDNHQGFYEYLKEVIPEGIRGKIEWKTNDGGSIKAADVVALALIALSKLPDTVIGTEIGLVKLYSSKQYCVEVFREILEKEGNGKWQGQSYVLESKAIESALDLVPKIIAAYDYVYKHFPNWYNKAGGSFGKIKGIRIHEANHKSDKGHSKKPFKTKYLEMDSKFSYADGFIIPIIVGLRELIEFKNGTLSWKYAPEDFLETTSGTIVSMYSSIIKAFDFNPGKIIKDKGSYDIVAGAIKMAMMEYKP